MTSAESGNYTRFDRNQLTEDSEASAVGAMIGMLKVLQRYYRWQVAIQPE
jgi:hypothetical protein